MPEFGVLIPGFGPGGVEAAAEWGFFEKIANFGGEKAMKDKSALKLPDDLYYSREHIWARPAGEFLEVGITDYAQDQLGGVVFVELPEKGQSFEAGDAFGDVESVKAVNSLFMPVAGEVVEINRALEEAPEKINSSCYGDGWILRIRPDNPEDVKKLMDAKAYRAEL